MEPTKVQEREFGRYRLVNELGVGGMGKVYRAYDTKLDRHVALKLIMGLNEKTIARFMQEATATAGMNHPNIVRLYDIGQEGGDYYFTMDLIEGGSLADMLLKKRKISPKQAAEFMAQAAGGVHYAHTQGVIHRDLKPSNILIDREGRPIIVDFGIAKLTKSGARLTKTGTFMGTATYMSPEQANNASRGVDERSDVYSLGAILYEMLAGSPPFPGDNNAEVLRQLFTKVPPKPSQFNTRLPKELDNICLKALEKEKKHRYRSAREFQADLENFVAGRPIAATSPSVFSHLRYWFSRYRRLVMGNVAALVILTVLLWAFLDARTRPSDKLPKPTQKSAGAVPKGDSDAPPKPDFPAGVWAEFKCETENAELKNLEIMNAKGLAHNPGHRCVEFAANLGSYLHIAFFLPQRPRHASLKMVHLTAALNGPAGVNGYSPIHIKINGKEFKNGYNVGDMNFREEEFPIESLLVQGRNDILLQLAQDARTRYWLKLLQVVINNPDQAE